MAFNNGFPVGYQPMFYQPQYQPTQNNAFPTNQNVGVTQPTQNGVIWVQGEAGAKSYLVAPNTTVQLWDSENQVIYLKSADASGMPSIKTLDYTIREMKQNTPSEPQIYATREELDALRAELESLLAARKTPVKAVRKEVEE